jgi:hypothetical protein
VLTFGRYLEKAPMERAAFVDRTRRDRETGRGYNPYSRFCAACRADLRFGTSDIHVHEAIADVQPQQRALYQELVGGYLAYRASIPDIMSCTEHKIRDAVTRRAGLTLKINPHLGLRRPDGTIEVTYFWFDQTPISPGTAQVLLRLMAQNMDEICPGGVPVVLDVRRGNSYRNLRGSGRRLDRYADGEAAAYVYTWTAVA